MLVVLDSHTLIWALSDSSKLSKIARNYFLNLNTRMCIPAIALAEINHLYNRGRINVSLSDVIRLVSATRNIYIAPIDWTIISLMPPTLEMHDAIIVATALREKELSDCECIVLSCDRSITDSGLIKVVW